MDVYGHLFPDRLCGTRTARRVGTRRAVRGRSVTSGVFVLKLHRTRVANAGRVRCERVRSCPGRGPGGWAVPERCG